MKKGKHNDGIYSLYGWFASEGRGLQEVLWVLMPPTGIYELFDVSLNKGIILLIIH